MTERSATLKAISWAVVPLLTTSLLISCGSECSFDHAFVPGGKFISADAVADVTVVSSELGHLPGYFYSDTAWLDTRDEDRIIIQVRSLNALYASLFCSVFAMEGQLKLDGAEMRFQCLLESRGEVLSLRFVEDETMESDALRASGKFVGTFSAAGELYNLELYDIVGINGCDSEDVLE